jgi:hypothetical protein
MRKIYLLLAVTFSLCLSSQINAQVNVPSKYLEPLPADLTKDGYVLIVKIPFTADKFVREATSVMEKHYGKPFIVIPHNMPVADSAYKDETKYRFVLRCEIYDQGVPIKMLSVFDRKYHKKYETGMVDYDLMALLKKCANRLNRSE